MGEGFTLRKCPAARGCIEANYHHAMLVLNLLFEEQNGISQGPTGNRWGDQSKVLKAPRTRAQTGSGETHKGR